MGVPAEVPTEVAALGGAAAEAVDGAAVDRAAAEGAAAEGAAGDGEVAQPLISEKHDAATSPLQVPAPRRRFIATTTSF